MPIDRIYLLGMPGSGKSTLAKQLAKEIDFHFIDLDELITLHERHTINEIFAIYGEEYFRQIEQKILLQTTTFTRTVIALGGGTPCFFDNMEVIKESGFSIYLDVPLDIIAKRLSKESNTRPLLNTKPEDLLTQITEKYNQRIDFYKQAHLTISGANLSVKDLLLWLSYMGKTS
ncbi:MAG: shikimate kinase [Cytophagales bacterium]|nr:MAG: shikimate kinase [Cytophagales bacterium]